MKTLEKIVKSYIFPDIEQNLDPLQFAYRAGKGVDDAKLFILNTLYKHLETPQSHARLLFADFSSAFNVMQPHILVNKLVKDFALDSSLVLWILDFLINRPQRVFVNSHYSNWKYTNTGSPQGCCLSPLIFIIYTDSFRSNYADRYLVKFADDTALLSLLNGSEQGHGSVLTEFEMHCDQAHLELNVLKTKELIVDFRKNRPVSEVSIIHGANVEIVTSYKYLGTIVDDKLKFTENAQAIVKKGQQRLYFLHKLKSFSVDKSIISLFYKSFIESVLSFSFICWFCNLNVKDKNALERIIRIASKIIGESQQSLQSFADKQILRKALTILASTNHILRQEFILLPSGKRFRTPVCKTNRHKFSFVPVAVRLLNI